MATPALRRLQLGWAAASVGTWGFTVVLSLYAWTRGGAAAVGLAAFARMAPAGLAAPFAALLADLRSRCSVLVGACAARAVTASAAALAAGAGAPLGVVLALAAVLTVISTAHKPAQAALLPQLARTPDDLAAANAAGSAIDNTGFLVGALGAGLAVAAASTQAAFAGTAVAFAAAAAILAALPRDRVDEHRGTEPGSTVARELTLGARAIAADRDLRLVAGLLTATFLAEGAIDVLVVVAALSVLGAGDAGVGVLNAAWGAGGLAGGVAAMAVLGRDRLAGAMCAGLVLAGTPLAALAVLPRPGAAIALFAVLGIGYALIEVSGLTFLQRLAGDTVLARVFGVLESGYWLATGLGAILAPALVAAIGARGALAAVGAALIVLAAVRGPALARLKTSGAVPARAFGLLRALPVFAPVPLAEVETLALRAVPVAVRGGETLFEQGDHGDRFYVVDAGRLEIVRDGIVSAVDGPGECFGETALLRDCPRTATVRALDDARLYALDRATFLAIVTGHPPARRAADRVMALHMKGAPA